MRTRPAATKLAIVFALATLVPFATGCSKSPKDKLQGKWVGEKVDNVPIDQEARATGWVKGTTFEFKGDKVVVTIPAEEPRTGTYSVSSLNANKLNVAFTRANGDVDEASFTLAGEGKVIKWDIGNERTITLARQLLDSAYIGRARSSRRRARRARRVASCTIVRIRVEPACPPTRIES